MAGGREEDMMLFEIIQCQKLAGQSSPLWS